MSSSAAFIAPVGPSSRAPAPSGSAASGGAAADQDSGFAETLSQVNGDTNAADTSTPAPPKTPAARPTTAAQAQASTSANAASANASGANATAANATAAGAQDATANITSIAAAQAAKAAAEALSKTSAQTDDTNTDPADASGAPQQTAVDPSTAATLVAIQTLAVPVTPAPTASSSPSAKTSDSVVIDAASNRSAVASLADLKAAANVRTQAQLSPAAAETLQTPGVTSVAASLVAQSLAAAKPLATGLQAADDDPDGPDALGEGGEDTAGTPSATSILTTALQAQATNSSNVTTKSGISASTTGATFTALVKTAASGASALVSTGHGATQADPAAAAPSAVQSQTSDAQNLTAFTPAPVTTPQTVASSASTAAGQGGAIVSQIADQITAQVKDKSTRFDIALDPAGLGHVNVKVQIGLDGQITAAMTFDNPGAASEAQGRAAELHQALQQSGFNLSQGGLSFGVGGQATGQNSQGGFTGQGAQTTYRADEPSIDDVLASAAASPSRAASGLDIRI